MSVKVSINVAGLRELEVALKELRAEVGGKEGNLVRTALMGAALPVLREAQARVPVDTGDLKKAIKRSRVPKPRSYSELVTVGVPEPVFSYGKLVNKAQGGHGKLVEFGTGLPKRRTPFSGEFMRPRPFLRPALEGNRDAAVLLFRQKLAAGIERVGKKIGSKNAAAVGARIKKL